jgi:hypothetical protein
LLWSLPPHAQPCILLQNLKAAIDTSSLC